MALVVFVLTYLMTIIGGALFADPFEASGEESTLAEGVMVPNSPRLKEVAKAIEMYEGV